MSNPLVYPVKPSVADHSHINKDRYNEMYKQSIEDPDTFWAEQAKQFITWQTPWERVQDFDFTTGHARWLEGAELNASFNCIDRHLESGADKVALIWEGDEPGNSIKITYQELHDHVCRLANALKAQGVQKGDRVCIYLPMILEASYAMLACARIGAVHNVVFGGFSPSSLVGRINDSHCKVVITADEGNRGGKQTQLKKNVDEALGKCLSVSAVIVVNNTGGKVDWTEGRDVWYHDIVGAEEAQCIPTTMGAEDPLFILYTSGSTGKPKGVVHTTGGYLLQAAMTFKYVMDYHDGEVYWCTADVGWITGHSYMVYGPLVNGATSLIFEGVPTYPTPSRCWDIVDKHNVAIFYSSPTAIRVLMAQGDDFVSQASRKSLRIIGTVGEPINPDVWRWYHRVVGDERCPVVDTWWQTETGGHMIAPLPGATDLKPGSASLPFFGVQPVLLDFDGKEIEGVGEGYLAIKSSWPGQIRTIYGHHARMVETYFGTYPGYYFTGDGAKRDIDGYYWITGRVDDVLNVSGHRMGTAEIESALVLHPQIAEAGVVGYLHPMKGQGIYAFVSTMKGSELDKAVLRKELINLCAQEIGPIAKPDIIHFVTDLPKTRSGKIMRRILRKIAADDLDSLGDTSTLANPEIVAELIGNHKT